MACLTPDNAGDLEQILREAAQQERSLLVQGRGTKQGWGNPVTECSELRLEKLSGIIDYQPAELFMTARAGTSLETIEAALAEHQQQLAFEPCTGTPAASDRAGSIGGVFACNLAGPRRFVAGAARDHLLGFAAVGGRGDSFRAGGTVVKNVTGYDMCKLMAGSFGTLGVMTALTFRVLPVAARRISLAITDIDTATALQHLCDLAASSWQPSGLCWLAPGCAGHPLPGLRRTSGSGILLIRLEGSPRGTVDRAHRLRGELGSYDPVVVLDQELSDGVWQAVRDLEMLAATAADDVLLRASLPASASVEVARRVDAYPDCRWVADHAGATFWIRVPATSLARIAARLRACLSEVGGVLAIVDQAPGSDHATPAFGPLPSGNAALNGRIKTALDPANLLNPGRLGATVAHADPL